MNRVDEVIEDVRARLGLSRLFARRILAELRDHLQDSVAHQLSRGVDKHAAQNTAVQNMGSPDELVGLVIDTNWELRMIAFLKTHLLATAAVLAAPGVLLLGLSFFTFNFPCREMTYGSMGEISTFTLCGVPALQSVRPLISEAGFYGGPAWLQWTIHILAVAGPLSACLLLIRSQLSLRRRKETNGTAEIALTLDRKHVLALAATLSVLLTVVVYKAAG